MVTTVAIAGISSRLALFVTQSLLKRPDVQIRGSCRDINKLPDELKSSPRITLIQSGPYDTDNLRALIRGSNVVICAYFANDETMLNAQKLLIDLCGEEGITRYIASDYTVDYRKLDWGDLPIKEPMKHVQTYLEGKPGVNGVHILVGLLMETFLDYFGIWDADKKKMRYWGSGDEKWDLTSYQTAAEYIAAVALDANATGFLKFRGEHKSARELAADIESVYGIKPVMESRGALTDLAQRLESKGDIQDVLNASAYFTLSGKNSLGEDVDNEKSLHRLCVSLDVHDWIDFRQEFHSITYPSLVRSYT
ncbi:uncharacterized protein ALTATR162_LOCUS4387 [Alternaria atra]|uniref:NmrA-like domain-containing protein n=1 Tax=Alternaria atra TaxID=119953 RepID=A0A8J2I5J1_9PLEO|nr:uncharacterized protein ALTATR162_LOCUS4387 [Alternaria atra]CAG5156590.1 unnamed protein product [Alternaria atra]